MIKECWAILAHFKGFQRKVVFSQGDFFFWGGGGGSSIFLSKPKIDYYRDTQNGIQRSIGLSPSNTAQMVLGHWTPLDRCQLLYVCRLHS